MTYWPAKKSDTRRGEKPQGRNTNFQEYQEYGLQSRMSQCHMHFITNRKPHLLGSPISLLYIWAFFSPFCLLWGFLILTFNFHHLPLNLQLNYFLGEEVTPGQLGANTFQYAMRPLPLIAIILNVNVWSEG